MNENKKNKTNIWMYAVVLFTSAFIVLLLTAYSQIKFNKNIDEYKNQIHSKENENNKFMLSLNTAIKENDDLKKEIESLQSDIAKKQDEIEKYKIEINDVELTNKNSQNIYEFLIKAENEYNKGNLLYCVEILQNNINSEYLGEEGNEKYKTLINKTYKKAAEQLYNDGVRDLNKNLYAEASEKFLKSISLTDEETFSDNCYYYLAYSEYKQEKIESASEYIKVLLNKYPESNYKNRANNLLLKLK